MPTVGKIGSDANSGKNRQRRFFDEHGLDAGLSRPGRRGCADEAGVVQTQRAVLESAAPTKSAKSAAGGDDESGWTDCIVQGLTKKTVGLDTGAVAARGAVSADSAAVSADSAALACWRGGPMRVGTWAAGSESKSFPDAAGKNAPRDGRVR